MSFRITLGRNDSDKNVLSKSVTALEAMEGVLRDECSISDPVVLIEHELDDTMMAANYATISAFGRNYYITDIRSIRTNLIELTLHVDVLASFMSLIRSNLAQIDKAETGGNRYLNDGTFRAYAYASPETIAFPHSLDSTTAILVAAGSLVTRDDPT